MPNLVDTRLICVSTMTDGVSKANLITHAAVFFPTDGNDIRSSGSFGTIQSNSSTIFLVTALMLLAFCL